MTTFGANEKKTTEAAGTQSLLNLITSAATQSLKLRSRSEGFFKYHIWYPQFLVPASAR